MNTLHICPKWTKHDTAFLRDIYISLSQSGETFFSVSYELLFLTMGGQC